MKMQQIQGIASKRTCKIIDHDELEISHICTYEQCDNSCRWVCATCILRKFHNHNFNDQKYLQDQKQFVAYLEQKKQNIEDNNSKVTQKIQDITEQLKNLIAEIDNLIKFLQTQISDNHLKQLSEVISRGKQSLFQLSDDELNQVILLNYNPNEIYEYQKLEQLAKHCTSRFEIFKNKNQPQFQDLYRQHYVKQETQIHKVKQDTEQNNRTPISKSISELGQQNIQNKQQFQDIKSGQSRTQYQQPSQMIAQQDQLRQNKSPLDQSRIKYEQPSNQMLNERKIMPSPQFQNSPTSNLQAKSQIRVFKPQDLNNDRQNQITPITPITPITKVQNQVQATPMTNQTQQKPSFGNNSIQNQPQSAISIQPQQKQLAAYQSPQRTTLPSHFNQQNQQQIPQIQQNLMGQQFQPFKK